MLVMIGVGVIFSGVVYAVDKELKRLHHHDGNAIRVEIPESLKWKFYLYDQLLEGGFSYRDYLIIKSIAEAESGFNQYDKNGKIIRGQLNQHDIGIFQINEIYHLKKSKELGMDIYTPEGNIDYAIFLYSKNGTKDWSWSAKIWKKKLSTVLY